MLILLASMPLVQDRPRQASVPETLWRGLIDVPLPDPQQGVIEEARRRQEQRRTRLARASIAATMLIALLWMFLELPQGRPARAGGPTASPAANHKITRAPDFNVRLVPKLTVGQVGWQSFSEEHGVQVGGSTAGPALSSRPFLVEDATSTDGSVWTARLVTTPEVATVLIGGRRAPTVSLPGLPYGYRAVRVRTQLEGTSIVALDADGRPLVNEPDNREPVLAKVHSWRYPGPIPQGSCGLRARPLPGLTAQGGTVATAIRPYSAAAGRQILGYAFLPCVSVNYRLGNVPMRALILLDAAHPSDRAAALPDFKPISGAPGLVQEGGALTARRAGDAWLIGGGGTVAQRVQLLRHLSALVSLNSRVPASAGIR